MAISFPVNPVLNQTYSYGGRGWIWNGTVWKSVGTTVGSQGVQGIAGQNGTQGLQGLQGPNAALSFGATPPLSPNVGDRWVDSGSGSTYTWMTTDGVDYFWVEVNASGFSGVQGIRGFQGIQGGQGLQGNVGAQGFGYAQLQGLQGIQGIYGQTGIQGNQGFQGVQGFGYAQLQGIQGVQGNFGPQGIQGGIGINGVQGLQGTQGIQGAYPSTAGVQYTSAFFNGTTSIAQMLEATYLSGVALTTGVNNYSVLTQGGITFYTVASTGNWTLNVTGIAGGTTLGSLMNIGQTLTIAVLATNGATPYYQSAMQIDGAAVTPKWAFGSAPIAGDANAIDLYSFSILKIASATYTVIGSYTKYA